MMLHAYSSLYLDKSSRTLGNMLHDAVIEFGMDGTDFLNRFIQSDIAEQLSNMKIPPACNCWRLHI